MVSFFSPTILLRQAVYATPPLTLQGTGRFVIPVTPEGKQAGPCYCSTRCLSWSRCRNGGVCSGHCPGQIGTSRCGPCTQWPEIAVKILYLT